VRENEVSLRKWFDGTAQMRTLEGAWVASNQKEKMPEITQEKCTKCIHYKPKALVNS